MTVTMSTDLLPESRLSHAFQPDLRQGDGQDLPYIDNTVGNHLQPLVFPDHAQAYASYTDHFAGSNNSQQQKQTNAGCGEPTCSPDTVDDDVSFIGSDDKQLCMLCHKRFDMDAERDLFLAHLVMDHNVVIADVKHVPYFPGYVEEWRRKFKLLNIDDVCHKIKTNVTHDESPEDEEAKEGSQEGSSSGCDAGSSSPDENKDSWTLVETQVGDNQMSISPRILAKCALEDSSFVPEAGDAPATDVSRHSPRPAAEQEDPAIAEARPVSEIAAKLVAAVAEVSPPAPSTSTDSFVTTSTSSIFYDSPEGSSHSLAEQGEEYHYLLCDAIPEDLAIRQKLQRKRLEYALQRQEAERNDNTFARQCLFCNAFFEGNRAALFHHMAEDHNFNVGQPDNIVFSNEFLDTLQSKLESSLCLYCEKDFRDKATLKDHMRKKMHRRIRGSNREYDKFYLINYLELGKSWNDIQSEEDIEIRPGPAAESEWADWRGEGSYSVCLFCTFPTTSAEDIFNHMRDTHSFDLSKIRINLKLSFYQQIKLINFYRRKLHECICPICLTTFVNKEGTVDHMQESGHITDVPALVQWDQPQFFFPTYENDHLLSLLEDIDASPEVAVVQPEDPPDSSIYNSVLSHRELRQEIMYDCGPQGYKVRGWK